MNQPLTGPALRSAINHIPTSPTPIIEEFLYEQKTVLVSADTGVGKSTLIGQMAVALSSGTRLFSYLRIPRPRNVAYLQLEGSLDESLERMSFMEGELPINCDNLLWDVPMLDCRDSVSVHRTLDRLRGWNRQIDVIILDPIYMAVGEEDLAKNVIAGYLVRFIDSLRRVFNCSVVLVHHTKKAQYASNTGKKIDEQDPFYGSGRIKWYVDAAYCVSQIEGGVVLSCKKSRAGNVFSELKLVFDPESFTNYVEGSRVETAPKELIERFLSQCLAQGKTTDFGEVQRETRLSVSTVRRVQRMLLGEHKLELLAVPGRKKLWRPKNPEQAEVVRIAS